MIHEKQDEVDAAEAPTVEEDKNGDIEMQSVQGAGAKFKTGL